MEQEKPNNSRRLYTAMKSLKKQTMGANPFKNLRPSEFHMMHAIMSCCNAQDMECTEGSKEPLPGITISALSRFTQSSLPGVSQIVRNLDEKGMVERIVMKPDRRVVYVRLSENGKTFLQEQEKGFLSLLDEICAGMGEQDTDQLILLLGKLQQVMSEVKKKHSP